MNCHSSNWSNSSSFVASLDGPLPVDPQVFALELESYWSSPLETGGLGNKSSDALRSLWEIMGDSYEKAISSRFSFPDTTQPYTVIQCPTGSAKTQGLCVYAALTAKDNRKTSDRTSLHFNAAPIGILVVVRLIEQANEITNTINYLSGAECAVASHGDNPLRYDDFKRYDVLVVTHKAYTNAVARAPHTLVSRYEAFLTWAPAPEFDGLNYRRLLVVVDEALANVVEMPDATLTNITRILMVTDHYKALRKNFRIEIATLEQIRTALRAFSERSDQRFSVPAALPDPVDFSGLSEAIGRLKLDFLFNHRESINDRARIAGWMKATLRAVEEMLSQWRYFSSQGGKHSINTSKFLIPEGLTDGAVFLDATAEHSFLWELIEDRRIIQKKPARPVRDYSNVTLHRAWETSGLGKSTFEERAKDRVPRLLTFIRDNIDPGRKVLIICHKKTEPLFLPYLSERDGRYWLDVAKGSSVEIALGHYGAIDGRNDWSAFDTVFLFGLPYLPQTWSYNVIFALTGFNMDLLSDPSMEELEDYPRFIAQRQMATSIIQAINRIRTRRVIDEKGRCEEAHVYLWLPHAGVEIYLAAPEDERRNLRPDGLAWLAAIEADMPGIVVEDWQQTLDGPAARLRRNSGAHAIVEYMRARLPGDTTLANLKRELGVSETTLKNIKPQLEDSDSPIARALAEFGVIYVKGGRGRGNSGKLVKA